MRKTKIEYCNNNKNFEEERRVSSCIWNSTYLFQTDNFTHITCFMGKRLDSLLFKINVFLFDYENKHVLLKFIRTEADTNNKAKKKKNRFTLCNRKN